MESIAEAGEGEQPGLLLLAELRTFSDLMSWQAYCPRCSCRKSGDVDDPNPRDPGCTDEPCWCHQEGAESLQAAREMATLSDATVETESVLGARTVELQSACQELREVACSLTTYPAEPALVSLGRRRLFDLVAVEGDYYTAQARVSDARWQLRLAVARLVDACARCGTIGQGAPFCKECAEEGIRL